MSAKTEYKFIPLIEIKISDKKANIPDLQFGCSEAEANIYF